MWAAAQSPGASGFRVIGKYKPFLNVTYLCGSPEGLETDVLIRKHTSLYICAGTAPGDTVLSGYSTWRIGHQLESLILAQNERWRHA